MALHTQLWATYGDVFMVYLGPRPVIILCGYEVLKEALHRDFGMGKKSIEKLIQVETQCLVEAL